MKKLLTVVFTMLLAGSLAFAQDTGGDKAKTTGKTKTGTAAAATSSGKTKTKAHKGGKKGKKSGTTTTTPPPK